MLPTCENRGDNLNWSRYRKLTSECAEHEMYYDKSTQWMLVVGLQWFYFSSFLPIFFAIDTHDFWNKFLFFKFLFPFSFNSSFFFKLRFYLFIFREVGKGGRRREWNINVWLPLAHATLGNWPATQACTLTGNQTSDALVHRSVLNPLSYTSQGQKFL